MTPGRSLGILAGVAAILIVGLWLVFGRQPGSPAATASPPAPFAGTTSRPSSIGSAPPAGGPVDQAGTFPDGLWAIRSTSLWISADAGATWSTGTIPTSPSLSDPPSTLVDVLDASHIWVLTGDDFGSGGSGDMTGTKDAITQDRLALTVNRSADGGRTWSRVVIDGTYPGSFQALHFVDATQGYLVISPGRFDTTESVVLRTADGGQTWHVAGTGGWLGTLLATPDASTIWAASAGDAGPVERRMFAVSRDAGRTWTDVMLPGVPSAIGQWVRFAQPPIFIGSTGIALVAPNDGSGISDIDRSDDGGRTWTRVATTSSPSLAVLRQDAWLRAGAAPGVLEVTTDAGVTWHTLATVGLPPAATITWLGFSDSTHGALTASTGLPATSGLYVSQDGGSTWRLDPP